eukprot:TRINITY_DN908_c0_g1_i4.p1 TRINITY_DN908_c0_g1~~TRINITY_DN908_c0_g1_i4.p1  ORF type:complete len:765 (-),score=51.87 TRINITY_DN908_c0_g1_i4:32-2326(-)
MAWGKTARWLFITLFAVLGLSLLLMIMGGNDGMNRGGGLVALTRDWSRRPCPSAVNNVTVVYKYVESSPAVVTVTPDPTTPPSPSTAPASATGEGGGDGASRSVYRDARYQPAWDPQGKRYEGLDYAPDPPQCNLDIHARDAVVLGSWSPVLEERRPGVDKHVRWSVPERKDGKPILCYSDPPVLKQNCDVPVYSNGIGYLSIDDWDKQYRRSTWEDRSREQLKEMAQGLQRRLWLPELDKALCERADENRYVHIVITTYDEGHELHPSVARFPRQEPLPRATIMENWITRMRHLGIHNWIMIVSDDTIKAKVERLGGYALNFNEFTTVWPVCHGGPGEASGALDMVLNMEIIKRGYHVIYSNVDVAWFQDYPEEDRQQDFAFTTYRDGHEGYLGHLQDPSTGVAARRLWEPSANYGEWFMRSNPRVVRVFFAEMALTLGVFRWTTRPACHDNAQWEEILLYNKDWFSPIHFKDYSFVPNATLAHPGQVSYRILSPITFPNSHSFLRGWAEPNPVSVHMTGYGSHGKSWNMRETGAWMAYGEEYFTGKYLAYKWSVAGRSRRDERKALESALAIAFTLNRSLILPSFACENSQRLKDPDLAFNPAYNVTWCPFDFFYDYHLLTQIFNVREPTFFRKKGLNYAGLTHIAFCAKGDECDVVNDVDSESAYWQYRGVYNYLNGSPIGVDGRNVSVNRPVPGPDDVVEYGEVGDTLTLEEVLGVQNQTAAYDVLHLDADVRIHIPSHTDLYEAVQAVLIEKNTEHDCC